MILYFYHGHYSNLRIRDYHLLMNSQRMSSESLLGKSSVRAKIDLDGIFIGAQQPLDTTQNSNFLGCISMSPSEPQTHILFKNILWCSSVDTDDNSFDISYVVEHNESVSVHHLTVELPMLADQSKDDMVKHILKQAYGDSKVQPSVLIVLNNHGGQGHALSLYNNEILPVLSAAHVDITFMEIKHSKHGVEIGREVDIDKFDILACCSGDGIPHEVINGMYERPDRVTAFEKLAIAQLPCGSGNAFSLSTHGSNKPGIAAFHMLKLTRARLDVMAVTQGTDSNEKTSLSFLSQAYGVIADSDIGTEHLRWMGAIRFELGVAHKVLTKAKYPCDLYVSYATKENDEILEHVASHLQNPPVQKPISEESFQLKYPGLDQPPPSTWEKVPSSTTDNLNIFYVGNMPYMLSDAQFFPAALPDDGHMDLVITNTSTPFFTMVKLLTSVDSGGHVHSPHTHHAKISGYRLVPRMTGGLKHYISVDGENFPFEAFQVEVLPRIVTVLLDRGEFVKTQFTKR